MKGKKRAQAANRHNLEASEQRATAAERKAARLEGELADLKASTAAQILNLQQALSAAKKQRDEAVSPLLLAAEERIRTLSAELLAEREEHGKIRREYRALCQGLYDAAHQDGLTPAEAKRRIANLAGESFTVAPDARTQVTGEPEQGEPSLADKFDQALAAKNLHDTKRTLRTHPGKYRMLPVFAPHQPVGESERDTTGGAL